MHNPFSKFMRLYSLFIYVITVLDVVKERLVFSDLKRPELPRSLTWKDPLIGIIRSVDRKICSPRAGQLNTCTCI